MYAISSKFSQKFAENYSKISLIFSIIICIFLKTFRKFFEIFIKFLKNVFEVFLQLLRNCMKIPNFLVLILNNDQNPITSFNSKNINLPLSLLNMNCWTIFWHCSDVYPFRNLHKKKYIYIACKPIFLPYITTYYLRKVF